jgi:hypothetical protein
MPGASRLEKRVGTGCTKRLRKNVKVCYFLRVKVPQFTA